MIPLFEQNFTLHPVGQGLFYTGVFSLNGNTESKNLFKMVFDCGSLTEDAGEEEAKEFNNHYLNLNGKLERLNLLIISHFDGDHVNNLSQLLNKGVIIDRLVLPYTSLSERVFLVVKHLMEAKAGQLNLEFIRFVLDPLGALDENLDEDSIVYIITSGPPDSPIVPNDNNALPETDISKLPEESLAALTFEIQIRPGEEEKNLSGDFIIPNIGGQPITVKQVKDTAIGYLSVLSVSLNLMEFIFYRKKITEREEEFYKSICNEFCSLLNIDAGKNPEELIDGIKAKLGELPNGKTIKSKVYKKVAENFKDLNISTTDASNLNTTALSMLHLNLQNAFASNKSLRAPKIIKLIQKFDGTKKTRSENPIFMDPFHPFYYFKQTDQSFPNCLLTSDSFLKDKKDVDFFYLKYQAYWNKFWLFQLPHHGSKNNADKNLFSRLNGRAKKFINYGTSNIFHHPHSEIFLEMQAAGCELNLFAINEYLGLKFTQHLYKS